MSDKRQINKEWEATNPLGERYRYAKIGSGKNSYIKTLAYLGTEKIKGCKLNGKTKNFILETLRNNTSLKGDEIMRFERIIKNRCALR